MAEVGRTIAREVRRHRQARGMSAQQLADTCEELGITVPRTVISNIENGRRSNVTMAEILILAAALDIPPTALVHPVGYVDQVEYLPGRTAPPLDAADWWHGRDAAEGSALALLRRHRDIEERIRCLYRSIWEQAIAECRWQGEDGPEAEVARQMAQELTAELHQLREEIAQRGLALPPLAGLRRPSEK